MRRLATAALLPLLILSACGPEKEPRTPITADEFTQRATKISGVTTVNTSSRPWTVGFDAKLPEGELSTLSKDVFNLVNEVQLPDDATVAFKAGTTRAMVERKHHGGGPQPIAPELRWVTWLGNDKNIGSIAITNNVASVTVTGATDKQRWTRTFLASTTINDSAPYLTVSNPNGGSISVIPGKPESVQNFRALDQAITTTAAKILRASCDITLDATIGVTDQAHAQRLVAALLPKFESPSLVDLSIKAENGSSWWGRLDKINSTLDQATGLPELVAATGANLKSASDHNSYEIQAPTVDIAEKVVQLVSSDPWTPGADSYVTIYLTGNANGSSSTAGVWGQSGPIWIDAIRSGLVQTRVTGNKGGSQERTFDIAFMQTNDVPDLTTPEGYQLIIDVMRRHDWQGRAEITLGYGDHLMFWSSQDGKAEDAYFALHGAKSRKPTGWALDFLKVWDATASR